MQIRRMCHQSKTGPYPQQVIDEANEDLETFCDFLRGESVKFSDQIENQQNTIIIVQEIPCLFTMILL